MAVNNALRRLEEANVVRRLNERKWGRAWECTELLELVEGFGESVTGVLYEESGRSSVRKGPQT